MWEHLASANYMFGLDTRKNAIASRWQRHLKNAANKDVKVMYAYIHVCMHVVVYACMRI
jgi:hypothetical protein